MAIWQFQCNIVPARKNMDRLSRDEVISWKDETPPSHDITFLAQEKSWSKDIVQYGKLDETCIEFIYADNILVEIDCRLDLRRLTKVNLVSLVEYARENGAMFLVGNVIYAPKAENLIEAMTESEANQYCKNPINYMLRQGNGPSVLTDSRE